MVAAGVAEQGPLLGGQVLGGVDLLRGVAALVDGLRGAEVEAQVGVVGDVHDEQRCARGERPGGDLLCDGAGVGRVVLLGGRQVAGRVRGVGGHHVALPAAGAGLRPGAVVPLLPASGRHLGGDRGPRDVLLEGAPAAALVDDPRAVEDVEVSGGGVHEEALVAVAVGVRLGGEGRGVAARGAVRRGDRVVPDGPGPALVGGDGVVDGVVVQAVAEGLRGELVVHQAVPVAGVRVDPDARQVAVVALGVARARRRVAGLPAGGAVVAACGGVVVAVGGVGRVDRVADRGGPGGVVEVPAGEEVPLPGVLRAVEGVRLLEVEGAVLVGVDARRGVVRVRVRAGLPDRDGVRGVDRVRGRLRGGRGGGQGAGAEGGQGGGGEGGEQSGSMGGHWYSSSMRGGGAESGEWSGRVRREGWPGTAGSAVGHRPSTVGHAEHTVGLTGKSRVLAETLEAGPRPVRPELPPAQPAARTREYAHLDDPTAVS